MEEISEARFYSIQELLDYAFRGETMKVAPKAIHIDYSRDHNALTPQEVIADCAMIKGRAMRSISSEQEWHTICAQYRRAVDTDLQDKEAYSLFVLSSNLFNECKSNNHLFIADTVREWSPNMRPYKTLKQWSDKMNIPYGRLRRWSNSKDPKDKSIKFMLNAWLSSAEHKLNQVFAEEGLIGNE